MAWEKVKASNEALKSRLAESLAARAGHGLRAPAALIPSTPDMAEQQHSHQQAGRKIAARGVDTSSHADGELPARPATAPPEPTQMAWPEPSTLLSEPVRRNEHEPSAIENRRSPRLDPDLQPRPGLEAKPSQAAASHAPVIGQAVAQGEQGSGPAEEVWEIVEEPALDPAAAAQAVATDRSAANGLAPQPIAEPLHSEAQAAGDAADLAPATPPAETVQEDGREKRRAPRKVHALAAQMHTSPGAPGIPCMVADMSATGARIKLIPGSGRNVTVAELPERLMLLLRLDRTQYHCEIVRREETSFGVRFLAAPTAATPDVRRTSLAKVRAQPNKNQPKKKSWF